MIGIARVSALLCLLVTGCGTAKKVAVTSFRIVDTPARYVRDRIDPPTTAGTSTEVSDVENPGRPVTTPTPAPSPRRSTTSGTSIAAAGARPSPTAAGTRNVPPSSGFPIARPVPGRPGYVYSLDPNGGIVDVTGYQPGDKAKDPYTKQVFIIP